jgi:hypothetical protein
LQWGVDEEGDREGEGKGNETEQACNQDKEGEAREEDVEGDDTCASV